MGSSASMVTTLSRQSSQGVLVGGPVMSELEPWRDHLMLTGTGTPKPLLANAITALREAPAWQGVLAYDEFALETVVTDAPPWHMGLRWNNRAWSSHDDLLTAEWLQRKDISV